MEYEKEVVKDLIKFDGLIDRGKALERLLTSPDFKSVVMDGFLHDLVFELLYNNPDDTGDTHQKLDSIKFFNEYLAKVKSDREIAETSKAEYQKELNNTIEE
jgi:hypothetical protein